MGARASRTIREAAMPRNCKNSRVKNYLFIRCGRLSIVAGLGVACLTLGGCPNSDNTNVGGAGGAGDGAISDVPAGGSGVSESESASGLQVFPADNPWNTDVSAYPVHANSANFIASIGAERGLHPDFGTEWEGAPIGIPYTLVDSSTPRVNVSFDYADESDAGPYPIPLDVLIEGGPNSSGDRHVILLDMQAKKLYELFAAYPQDDGSWSAGSGAIWDLTSNDRRPWGWTSADAAGLAIFPGLVRYDEVVEQGEIRHALRFTVSRSQRAAILPATHFASSNTDPNLPPMGLRVRLKADFDISGFSANVQVILRAMKRYGMIVADNGSNWYVSGAPDARWNDDELRQLKQVYGRDFEVVDTGPALTADPS